MHLKGYIPSHLPTKEGSPVRLWILAAALACSTAAQAATVVKCTDASGKVTFAQNVCPGDTQGGAVEVKAAARPSGEGPAVQLADPSKTYVAPKPKPKPKAPEPEIVYKEVPVEVPVPVYIKPCVKYVDVKRHVRETTPDGRVLAGVQIDKVPVPCDPKK
jgi:predicted outer membrane repeat protein